MPRTEGLPTGPAARRATPRIGLVDLARVVAVLAVIWIHTPEVAALERTTLLCRFAVPFFAFAAGYFGVTGRRATLRADLGRRTRRLYGMFLAWCAVYALARWATAAVTGTRDRFSLPPLLELLTSGSTHHLWFLPFAVVVSVVAALMRRPPPFVSIAFSLLLAVVVLAFPRPAGVPATYFLALARDNLPAGMAGVALGLALPDRQRLSSSLRPFVVPGSLLTAGCLVLQFTIGRSVIVENLLGVSIFVLAAGLPARDSETIQALGEQTLGVYLVHVLFVEGLQDVLHAVLRLPSSPTLDLTVFAVSALSSFTLARALLRWPRTRWLVAPS